jgi:hypothetical protein
MKIEKLEELIIERILPKLEKRLEKRLTEKLLATIERYSPESKFKPKFIREVKAAQKRIEQGKGKNLKT